MLEASKRGAEAVVDRRGMMGDYLQLVNDLSRTILNEEDNLSRDQDFSGISFIVYRFSAAVPQLDMSKPMRPSPRVRIRWT